MSNTPTNSDDVIDSRDIIARIDELEASDIFAKDWVTEKNQELETSGSDERVTYEDAPTALDEEEKAELAALLSLAEEGEGSPDWTHGETLIRDSHFEDYAQELAEDIGAIKSDAGWPYTCIDWEQAAKELQMDYSSVDFDGVEYWIRS